MEENFKYNDSHKESIIAAAMDTSEGRMALAQAIAEPIKRSLEYQAIGRKLLMVDELPQGAFERYARDVNDVYVINGNGTVPRKVSRVKPTITFYGVLPLLQMRKQ